MTLVLSIDSKPYQTQSVCQVRFGEQCGSLPINCLQIIGDVLSNWPKLYFLPPLRLNDSKSLMYRLKRSELRLHPCSTYTLVAGEGH